MPPFATNPAATPLFVSPHFKSENPYRVFIKKQSRRSLVELQYLEILEAILGWPRRKVRAEEHLLPPMAAHIVDEFWRISASLVGGSIDVDVRIFCRQ